MRMIEGAGRVPDVRKARSRSPRQSGLRVPQRRHWLGVFRILIVGGVNLARPTTRMARRKADSIMRMRRPRSRPATPAASPFPRKRGMSPLSLREGDAALTLVLAALVLVRGPADFIGLEEQHLRYALVGVEIGRAHV